MKYFFLIIVGVLGFAIAQAAPLDPTSDEAKRELKQPVNCATAEGDLRVLESEKTHVIEQVARGYTAVTPVGFVSGVVLGTEGEKLEVATGAYDSQLDAKIAEIKKTCGIYSAVANIGDRRCKKE